LGTWIGAIKALDKVDHQDAMKKLTTPTLILWGVQDVVTDAVDQAKVKSAFRTAAEASGTKVYYKVYGKDVLKKNHSQSGAGHNLHWVAHRAVAQDIANFIGNGSAFDAVPIADIERLHPSKGGKQALLKH
jgi:pimeloyl-ACP methyl ester carboxylesterase